MAGPVIARNGSSWNNVRYSAIMLCFSASTLCSSWKLGGLICASVGIDSESVLANGRAYCGQLSLNRPNLMHDLRLSNGTLGFFKTYTCELDELLPSISVASNTPADSDGLPFAAHTVFGAFLNWGKQLRRGSSRAGNASTSAPVSGSQGMVFPKPTPN